MQFWIPRTSFLHFQSEMFFFVRPSFIFKADKKSRVWMPFLRAAAGVECPPRPRDGAKDFQFVNAMASRPVMSFIKTPS